MSFHFFFANKDDFLLDKIRSIFATSTSRKLSSNASYAMRIRRASDDAELDVGFAGNSINNKAIKDFGGYNRVQWSEQIDQSTWIKTNTRVIANAISAPDGTVTADLLERTDDGIKQRMLRPFLESSKKAGDYTASLHVKPNSGTQFTMRIQDTSVVGAHGIYNLTGNGSVTFSAGGSGSIEALGNGWYRCTLTINVPNDVSGLQFILWLGGYGTSNNPGSIYFWGAQFVKGSDALIYQKREQAGASDCFVTTLYDQSGNGNHATQTVVTNQPKIYDVLTGDVTKENGKPAIVFDGADDHLLIPNVAGRSNIDAYFVNRHDASSTTAIDVDRYLYFGDDITSRYGFVAHVSGLGVLHNQYGTPNLYKNNTLLSPTNRGEVYSFIGQTQNIINHQGANLSNWAGCNFGRYPVSNRSWDFEGTLQEIIIFDRNLTTKERTLLHSDINNHFNIY